MHRQHCFHGSHEQRQMVITACANGTNSVCHRCCTKLERPCKLSGVSVTSPAKLLIVDTSIRHPSANIPDCRCTLLASPNIHLVCRGQMSWQCFTTRAVVQVFVYIRVAVKAEQPSAGWTPHDNARLCHCADTSCGRAGRQVSEAAVAVHTAAHLAVNRAPLPSSGALRMPQRLLPHVHNTARIRIVQLGPPGNAGC